MKRVYPIGWTQKQIQDYESKPLDPDSYDTGCTQNEICRYLRDIRRCIKNDKFQIESGDPDDLNDTRSKNDDFINIYSLSEAQQKDLLLSLDETEFCHVKLTNDNRRLYVFCKTTNLDRSLGMESESVAIYIKHDYDSGRGYDYIISFHALEQPIDMPFAD